MSKFYLKKQKFIELKIRVYRGYNKRRGLYDPQFVKLNYGEDVGSVGFGSNHLVLKDKRRKYDSHYMISMEDLWEAFQQALDREGA